MQDKEVHAALGVNFLSLRSNISTSAASCFINSMSVK